MGHFTLTGCSALVGAQARFERGPLDIVVTGDRIDAVRRTGEQPPSAELTESPTARRTAAR